MAFLVIILFLEPAAQSPHLLAKIREQDGKKIRRYSQGRRGDRILRPLKIAGKILVQISDSCLRFVTRRGPQICCPWPYLQISLLLPLPCAEEKNESLGKNPMKRQGLPDRRGPTDHKSQPQIWVSLMWVQSAILRGGKILSERRLCLLVGFFPKLSFLSTAPCKEASGETAQLVPQ